MPKMWQDIPDQIKPRPSVLKSYVENQLAHLKLVYPEESEEVLREIVREAVKDTMSKPKCQVITYPDVGQFDLVDLPLSTYIKNHCKDVLAPCGTVFKSDPDHLPSSVKYNNICRLNRSKFKKMMFACAERGDVAGEQHHDGNQQLAKIKNNSIIGGHGFEGSPFYDKESFNAITSLGRNGVILSYSLAEQCLANNFFWINEEKLINFVICTIQGMKDYEREDQVNKVLEQYKLYLPSPEELAKRLMSSTKYYMDKGRRILLYKKLTKMFGYLSPAEKAYLFYRRNLINLFTYNSDLFRGLVDGLRQLDDTLKATGEYQKLIDETTPDKLFEYPEDLRTMLAVIYNRILDYKAINQSLVKDHPKVASEFTVICQAAQEHLTKYEPIYEAFMYTGETIGTILENKYIIRRAVAVSDTDSLLFTMKAPVSWYLEDDFRICPKGIDMAAYTVYQLSKVLNVANRDLAISKGSVREYVERINLKNEYLYGVFVKTDLGKHYYTKYLAREGRIAKDPKMDIKGVELQTSTLPKVSRDFAKKIMTLIIDDVYTYGNVCERDLITLCLEYEQQIFDSLRTGRLDYYANVSIKDKDQYKQPERSIYFNWKFWHHVFEPEYGPIHLPGKYPLVPFKPKTARSVQYLDWLKDNHSKIYKRYLEFLNTIDKKKNLTRIPIPGELTKVPEVLIPCIDMRTIIYKNLAPTQLALKQLGIYCGKQKQRPLMMDTYSEIIESVL